MRRSVLAGIAVALLMAGVARESAAQETFTPVFKSPYRAFKTSELGVSFSDPGEGVSLALEGFYGFSHGLSDFGIRVGFMDTNGGDTPILLGGSFRTRVVTANESFPLDGALTLGFGGAFDGGNFFSVPIGISLGRRVVLENSKISFVPYVQPVLQQEFGDNDETLFSLGLGVDMRLSPRFDIRVSGGIGDIEGVSISAAFIR